MNIRQLAESDLGATLEDVDNGFGWAVTLTDPAGLSSVELSCQSGDISQAFDPETGELVSNRTASAVFRISTLETQGFTSLPKSIASAGSKPWLVAFDDINGKSYTFKVSQSFPDRTLGVVKCKLEAYRVGA